MFKRDTRTEGTTEPSELLSNYASITPSAISFTSLLCSLLAWKMGMVPILLQSCQGNW